MGDIWEAGLMDIGKKGGQTVGHTTAGVWVRHKPTGLYAECNTERSQHKNRTIAMSMVEYGLVEMGWNL